MCRLDVQRIIVHASDIRPTYACIYWPSWIICFPTRVLVAGSYNSLLELCVNAPSCALNCFKILKYLLGTSNDWLDSNLLTLFYLIKVLNWNNFDCLKTRKSHAFMDSPCFTTYVTCIQYIGWMSNVSLSIQVRRAQRMTYACMSCQSWIIYSSTNFFEAGSCYSVLEIWVNEPSCAFNELNNSNY